MSLGWLPIVAIEWAAVDSLDMTASDQTPHDVRFEWGMSGLVALRECMTFIIVDVLSFSTCVSIVVDRSGSVLPFHLDAGAARLFAAEHGAILAASRGEPMAYSLSPQSLLNVPTGIKLVLPSPNGAALSVAASSMGTVLAGCFRCRAAVARFASTQRFPVAVIAGGERWSDGSLRPCLEDLCGAGAIISALPGSRSPEARVAVAAFSAVEGQVEACLLDSVSGRELTERGFREDVHLAAVLDASEAAPTLREGAFVRA